MTTAKTTAAAPSAKKSSDPYLGRVVAGRYRLEQRLGEGGMGVVYKARHVLIDRTVALKLIRPDLRGESHLRAWMLREARAANRVDHAHIIDIHDIGETEEGELYLVMEFLVGSPLSTDISKGPFPIARAVDILEQMAAALGRAHDLGVVHRDLKSDNIHLTNRGGRKDFVKILDFGLAALARDPRLAPKGAVFGTPEYMAPEQARGEDAIPQSDLYALGILFFEMVTGQLPFRSHDRDTLLEMQRTGATPNPRTLRPDLAPAAESIILKLLQKSLDKRYKDAHHLSEDLKALQRSMPSSPWEVLHLSDAPAQAPAAPPAPSAGVAEWATRAAHFARMVARAWPQGDVPSEVATNLDLTWSLASRASRLEGEVSSLSRRLEALEKRGRALRAEIGRKVEELAHEESRVLRDTSAEAEKVADLRERVSTNERAMHAAKLQADSLDRAGGSGATLRTAYEQIGSAVARLEIRREQLAERETRSAKKETQARDLRRQIEELRAQLARYAEALEDDLAQGRERVTNKTREGLALEKQFGDASVVLVKHLRGRPECRDLFDELTRKQSDGMGEDRG
ncbi:MAG: protein kinase [Deltaproteobacteria bacterium]|nr:protein kinase [Deltaproteobacteria bacterium]